MNTIGRFIDWIMLWPTEYTLVRPPTTLDFILRRIVYSCQTGFAFSVLFSHYAGPSCIRHPSGSYFLLYPVSSYMSYHNSANSRKWSSFESLATNSQVLSFQQKLPRWSKLRWLGSSAIRLLDPCHQECLLAPKPLQFLQTDCFLPEGNAPPVRL